MRSDIAGKLRNGPDGAWTLVPLHVATDAGKIPMKGKWVYAIKPGPIFKARWVGCGYSQTEGIDYQDTFASTIRSDTVRLFFIEAAFHSYELLLGDVVKAFTHARMDEELYVDQPRGFEVEGMTCRLNQALEGTKQAAHLWMQYLTTAMTDANMVRSKIDPNLWIRREGEMKIIAIVHVDDIAFAHNSPAMFKDMMLILSKHVNMKTGPLNRFLGIDLEHDLVNKSITLSQSKYIGKLAELHLDNGYDAKITRAPCGTTKYELTQFMAICPTDDDAEAAAVKKLGYLSIVGGLMYAACMTMPDLAYHVAHLARCMQSPSKKALLAVKRVLSYAYHRRNIPLTLGGNMERNLGFKRAVGVTVPSHSQLEMFSDSSFGGTKVKPMGGGFVRWRGSTTAWCARLLKFVPLSSAEAEVAAIVMMLKVSLFIMMLLEDLGIAPPDPIQGYTDSKSGKDIVVNPGVTKHTAHFCKVVALRSGKCAKWKTYFTPRV